MVDFTQVRADEIDLPFVKNYLRVDYDEDDNLLTTMIFSAKSYVQNYLNKRFDEYTELPAEFTIATLSIISHWYENRVIQSEKSANEELKHVFTGMLDYFRDWNDIQQ